MIEVADELKRLMELATTLNRLPGVSRRDPEAWHIARDSIARELARGVGRIRKALGIAGGGELPAFRTEPSCDTGIRVIRQHGRSVAVVRRSLG